MALTNIFLIGAPKCGTSSLFEHLALHSRVQGTSPKETFALLPNDHPLRKQKTFCDLADLDSARHIAPEMTDPSKILLEGTTHHLFFRESAEAVASLGDRAKSIVLLRNPAKRILSSFLFTKQNLARIPANFSFASYVDLLLAGEHNKIAEKIKHPVSAMVLASELRYSNYHHHLKSWQHAVGPQRLRVIISEDYFADPEKLLAETFAWLGLDVLQLDPASLALKNPTRTMGSLRIHKIARALNRWSPGGKLTAFAKSQYFQTQKRFGRQETEDYAQPMRKLDDYFGPQRKQLAKFLDRDLSVWESSIPA